MSTFKKICITNRHLAEGDLVERMARLVKQEIDLFILREKDMPESEYEKLAARIIPVCAAEGKTLMLHTFTGVAKRLGHPFIHLTMADFRKLSDEELRWFQAVGVSTHTVEEAVECEKRGASYVTASHIFPTDCKPGIKPRGLDYLRDVCRAVNRTEVYALGGICEDNQMLCLDVGADGVCMMSGYMRGKDE